MVGILQVILRLDPIAGKLRIPRQRLVLLKQLGGVTALAVVLAIAPGLPPEILWPLAPTAATAAVLSIVDQMLTSLSQSLPLLPSRTGRRDARV
jgi:hypothetical protein